MKRLTWTLAISIGVLLPVAVDAQSTPRGPSVKATTAAPKVPLRNPSLADAGPPPRNADGHADLNGMWDFLTGTPIERPAAFGTRLFLGI